MLGGHKEKVEQSRNPDDDHPHRKYFPEGQMVA
jgi:hypothetical protein